MFYGFSFIYFIRASFYLRNRNVSSLFDEVRSHQTPPQPSDEDVFVLFRISFMYYALIGCLVVWIVAYPISLMTEAEPLLDENLLAPFMRRKPQVNENELVAEQKTISNIK